MISINTSSSLTYNYGISNKQRILNSFNKIYKAVSNILFVVVACLLVTVLFYSFYTKKFGTNGKTPIVSAYVIISPSMVPTVNVNDAVIAIKPSVDNLSKNDIITFKSNDVRYSGLTVTHRIINVFNEGTVSYQTKGDSNTTADDAYVPIKNVIGKVVFVIPFLGYVRAFLTMPVGWILMIALPCVLIIIYDILKLSKSIKTTKSFDDYKFKDVEILDVDGDDSYEKK